MGIFALVFPWGKGLSRQRWLLLDAFQPLGWTGWVWRPPSYMGATCRARGQAGSSASDHLIILVNNPYSGLALPRAPAWVGVSGHGKALPGLVTWQEGAVPWHHFLSEK